MLVRSQNGDHKKEQASLDNPEKQPDRIRAQKQKDSGKGLDRGRHQHNTLKIQERVQIEGGLSTAQGKPRTQIGQPEKQPACSPNQEKNED